MKKPSFYLEVYKIVRKIPKGRVTTYGTIAMILDNPRAARAVGYALNALKKNVESQSIPWHRVINAKGQISHKGDSSRASLQKKLLLAEGIFFNESESIDFKKYAWINS